MEGLQFPMQILLALAAVVTLGWLAWAAADRRERRCTWTGSRLATFNHRSAK